MIAPIAPPPQDRGRGQRDTPPEMADDLFEAPPPTRLSTTPPPSTVLEGCGACPQAAPPMYITAAPDERALLSSGGRGARQLDGRGGGRATPPASRLSCTPIIRSPSATTARGIPGRPAPEISPGKSALEVILCTLHAGGKVLGARPTRPRAGCTASARLCRQCALSTMSGSRSHANPRAVRAGVFQRGIAGAGAFGRRGRETAAAPRSPFTAGRTDLRSHRFQAGGGMMKMVRSKGLPVFPASRSAGRPRSTTARRRRRRCSTSPVASPTTSRKPWAAPPTYSDTAFAGKVAFKPRFNQPGSVEWAINWTPARRRLHPVLFPPPPLQHRAHARGRHARGRVLGRDPQGHPRLWRIVNEQPQGRQHHPRRSGVGRRRAGVVLQSPSPSSSARPRTASPPPRPRAWSRARCATISTTGWRPTRNPPARSSISSCCGPRNACAVGRKKGGPRARPPPRELRLPRQAGRIARNRRARARNCSSSRVTSAGDTAKMARDRPRNPGAAALARQRSSTCWARPSPPR